MKIIGLILLSFGIVNALITAIGLCRTQKAPQRIHVTSMIAIAALAPSMLGAALYIGSTGALIRVAVASVFLFVGAPYLSQALLLRAVADGQLEMPPTQPLPESETTTSE